MRLHPAAAFLFALLAAPPALAGANETFRRDRAVLDPFPREVPAGASLTLRAVLRAGFRDPVLVQTRPAGDTAYFRPERSGPGRAFEFDVPFAEGAGAYRMELVVDSDAGDGSAAQFTVWAGVPAPEELPPSEVRRPETDYPPERPDEHPVRLERTLHRRINGFRREEGLAPLPWLEQAAILAREHLADFLALSPRPKDFVHVIPGKGSIADRLEAVYAWPRTVRKFPVAKPEIGPEAVCYCSESLAAPLSLEWLFREVLIRESAHRAPVVSSHPTHAAVGIVRPERSNRLYLACVSVQVNSTRVREELEAERRDTLALESGADRPEKRALFLRRLGRLGDGRDLPLFADRLRDSAPEVRAAALDALFLGDPERAEEWVATRALRLVRAHREGRYPEAIPILRTLSLVEYDAATGNRGRRELSALTRHAETVYAAAERLLSAGDGEYARETFALLAEKFEGLPVADRARERLRGLSGGDGPPPK